MLVVCNGMYRSGSTLQYRLAVEVCATASECVDLGFADWGEHPEATIRAWAEANRWHVVKAHQALPGDIVDTPGVVVLYTYRDLRDVAASILALLGDDWARVLGFIDDGVEQGRRIESRPIVAQRYEDLVAGPEAATREIARAIGVDVDDATIDRLVNAHSRQRVLVAQQKLQQDHRVFHALKRGRQRVPPGVVDLVRRSGLHRVWRAAMARLRPADTLHTDHISSSGGEPGAWRNVLSPARVDEIEQRYGPWLAAHGYLVGTSQSDSSP